MKDPESRTVFAGVDGRAEAQLPDWYAEKREIDDPVSFADAVWDLPRASEATVAYQNPITDEWVYEEQLAAEDGERSLEGEQSLASIERVGEDVRAKADQFEDREEALRERFRRAAN